MIFKVRMLAFENLGTIREVEVPDSELQGLPTIGVLEKVYHYGQNDVQPQECCSVSMGDVAEVNGKLYICQSAGWAKISTEDFNEYASLDRRARHFSKFVYPHEIPAEKPQQYAWFSEAFKKQFGYFTVQLPDGKIVEATQKSENPHEMFNWSDIQPLGPIESTVEYHWNEETLRGWGV